jgi:CspA family cold shock protein
MSILEEFPPPSAGTSKLPEKTDQATDEIKGRVKWFDLARGYGFIEPEACDGDIFFHAQTIRSSRFTSLPEGTSVTCTVVYGPRGRTAVKLVAADFSTVGPIAQPARAPRYDVVAPGEYVDAVVRWFNKSKGYGFVSRGEGTPDLFIHADILRKCGIHELYEGQPVKVRAGHGPRGEAVVEILNAEASCIPAV